MTIIKLSFAQRRMLLRKRERKGWSRNARNEEQGPPRRMLNGCVDSLVVQVAGGTITITGSQAGGVTDVAGAAVLRG